MTPRGKLNMSNRKRVTSFPYNTSEVQKITNSNIPLQKTKKGVLNEAVCYFSINLHLGKLPHPLN